MDRKPRTRILGRALIGLIAAAGIAAGTAGAEAQGQLKAVKIGVGGTSILNLTYYYLLLPGPLGYWKDEGYDVEVFPVSGSTEAAQQLTVGNLDFAQMNSSAIIQANVQHDLPVRAVVTTGVIGWGVAAAKDGPVKAIADLKGKSIGIVSLSSGGIPLLNSYLKSNGLNPEGDVTLIATGVGPSAMNALQTERVQALMYWSSALVGFKNAGLDMNILRDPKWANMPDFTLATSKAKVDADPAMVEGIARGVAKAMVFAAANPDCVRKLQWANYPDTKPTGVSEEQAAVTELSLLGAILSEQEQAAALNPGNRIAGVSAEGLGAVQKLLFEAGVVSREIDPSTILAGDDAFWARVNDFDRQAIEAQAKACNIPG